VKKSNHGSLVLCGGGIDSFVATWENQLNYPNEPTTLLYIDYGAKARLQELRAVTSLQHELQLRSNVAIAAHRIPSDLWTRYLSSPLTNPSIKVNEDPQIDEATEWVPARNTVLMAMALAVAESRGLARIIVGINRTAAVAYPDNSLAWLDCYDQLAYYAVNKGTKIKLVGPVASLEKYEIINRSFEIGMTQEILGLSWSCYKAGSIHCGKCSSCISRKYAFKRSIWNDPTKYEVNE
jgi:7-cyano-7-deazaguanine synthase